MDVQIDGVVNGAAGAGSSPQAPTRRPGSSTASKPAALLLLADYSAAMERLGLDGYVFGAQAAAPLAV